MVLHDADCGFCARCARLITRLGARVTVGALQIEDLVALGVDPERAIREMPVVHPDGRISWGHEAWADILRAGPLPLRLAGRLLGSRVMRRPGARVYRWIAEHRHAMPGGSGACALPPARLRDDPGSSARS